MGKNSNLLDIGEDIIYTLLLFFKFVYYLFFYYYPELCWCLAVFNF